MKTAPPDQLDTYQRDLKSTLISRKRKALEFFYRHPIPAALPELVILTQRPNAEVRYLVAKTLSNYPPEDAGETLVNLLDDDNSKVRYQACISLGTLLFSPAIPRLIIKFNDDDENVRYWAVKAIIRIGEPAVPKLIASLADQSWQVRANASQALSEIVRANFKPLLNALVSENSDVRFWVIKILGNIGRDSYLDNLNRFLIDPDDNIRIAAIEALGKIGADESIDKLILLLEDRNVQVRQAAADALTEIGDSSVEPLLKMLSSQHWPTRKLAASVLGKIGGRTVEKLLAELSRTKSDDARFWLIKVLGELGDKIATLEIMKYLKQGSRENRRVALEALVMLKDERSIDTLVNLLAESDETGELSARALSQMGDLARQKLINSLGSDKWLVRKNAAHGLKSCSAMVVDSLIELLDIPNDDVCFWVTEVLTSLGLRVEQPLISILKTSNHRAHIHAIRALGEIGSRAAVSRIISCLKDEYWSIRKESAKALGKIGDPSAIPDLINCLEDEDEELRAQSLKSLASLGAVSAGEQIAALLSDSFATVREEAVKAVGHLKLRKLETRIMGLLDDEVITVRHHALLTLGKLGSVSAVPFIVRMMKLPEFSESAIESLILLDDRAALRPLVNVLKEHQDRKLRAKAAYGLGVLGYAAAREPLMAALMDPYWNVRKNSVWALSSLATGRIKPEAGFEPSVSSQEQQTPSNFKLGLIFKKSRKNREAIMAFQRALQERPGFYDAYIQLGSVYLNLSMLNEAQEQFNKAIDLESYRPEAHVFLGLVEFLNKNYQRVLSHLSKANPEKIESMRLQKIAVRLIKITRNKIATRPKV